MRVPDRLFDGYVFDLDGTVYLGDELLPEARETLDELKQRSSVVYLTNKPLEMPADYAAKLTRLGVKTRPEEVISSTDALLLYLGRHAPDARLFVVGERPLIQLLTGAGYEVVQEAADVDVVVVSFDRTFDYRNLKISFDAVRGGARIVATNPDAYCPTPGGGGLPDCAAMLAAIEASTGAVQRLLSVSLRRTWRQRCWIGWGSQPGTRCSPATASLPIFAWPTRPAWPAPWS